MTSAGEDMVPKQASQGAPESEEAGRCDVEGQAGLAEPGSLLTPDGPHGPWLPTHLHGPWHGWPSPWPSPAPSLPPRPAWGPALWPDEI